MGYLGKISAVVTANTVDFTRNLNGAANDLKRFAGAVERDITRATNDANRAFTSMLTPLQRLEQGLRAASSMKLSFKGFAGAIRDVDALKQRLATLKSSDVNLVVRASGMRSISEFRAAVEGIDDKALNFVVNFGGLDRVREIQRELAGLSNQSVSAVVDAGPGGVARLRELRETVRELGGTQLALALRVGGTERLDRVEQQAIGLSRKDLNLLTKVGGVENLDRVIEEIGKVSSTSINALINIRGRAELDQVLEQFRNAAPEQIQAVISVLGVRDVEDATNRVRALYSASKQVFEPIAAAATSFEKFGADLQNAFGPALIAVQRQADRLKQDIESGVSIGEQRFNGLAASAQRVVEAVDRIGEATQAIAGFNPGTSLAFTQPESLAAINRARRLQEDALKLSPEELRQGQFAFRSGVVAQELQELARLQANREGIAAQGPAFGRLGADRYRADLAAADEAIATQVSKVNSLAEAWQRASRAVRANAAEQSFLAQESLPFVDVGTVRARAVDARQVQLAAVEIGVALDEVQRSARRVAQIQAEGRFNVADSLPFVDVGTVRARAVDARQVQLAAVEIGVALDEVQRSARRVAQIQAEGRFNVADALPFVDVGTVRARAVDARQAQLAAEAATIAVTRDELVSSGFAAQERLRGALPFLDAGFLAARGVEERQRQQAARDAQLDGFVPFSDVVASARRVPADFRGDIDRLRSEFGSFDAFINAGRIRSAFGELEALRGILARVGAQASGPAVQAFNRFREAVALSLDNPGSVELQQAVDVARDEAITATSQISGAGSRRRIRSRLRRAGDVGRFGADNISLALNQAAFAVDDFFSSTGGLEFKIRAISNNITQLGFIVGGTAGLFVSLGTVIAAQAAIGISKWINNGRTAEDQTKALNDSLARQKTLVEELADSFRSLGDAIAERTFSEPAQTARAFQRQLAAVAQQQQEFRNERAGAFNPRVQIERANQNRIRRELENESDVASRIVLERQLQESRQREQAAARVAGNRRGVPGGLVRQTVLEASLTAESTAFGPLGPVTQEERQAATQRARATAARVDVGSTPEAILSQRRALEEARSRLEESASQRVLGLRTPAARLAATQLAEVENLLRGIEAPLRDALDNAALNLFVVSNDAATQIEQAQSSVAEAIAAGVPGARLVQQQLNSLGSGLEQAFADLEAARRNDNVDEQTRLQEQASRRIAGVLSQQSATIERADAIRREQTVDPQRALEARLQRAQQNLQGGGLADGQVARRLREIEFQRETLRQQASRFANDPVFARAAEQSDVALRQEAAALEAATIAINRFSEALNRASQEASQNLQAAQQAADQARRDDLGFSTQRTRDERAASEAALRRQIELEREAQVEVANARGRLEAQAQTDPALRGTFQRIQEIGEQLSSGNLAPEQQAALRQERAALESSIDAMVSTDPRVVQARDASTREEEQRQAAARGRGLAQTPAQRAAQELSRGIEDIRQAFGQAAVEGTGLVDVAGQNEAISRFAQEQLRQTAPAIFALSDSVENAVLQGPSRAALGVADISTQDGARELNRLLRGDDSARDQNLVELQKQSQALEEIQRTLREGVNGVRAA